MVSVISNSCEPAVAALVFFSVLVFGAGSERWRQVQLEGLEAPALEALELGEQARELRGFVRA